MTTDTTAPDTGRQAAADLAGKRRLYLTAMFVDSIGSGLWMPFGLIFFSRAQHIPIGQAGSALTIGGLAGLVLAPLGGSLVDRAGPGFTVVLSNLLRTLTFAVYPFVAHAWQIALLAVVTAGSDRLFWTANSPLLKRLMQGRKLENLLATQNVIRIVGLGLGAGIAGSLAGTVTGLHVVAYVNSATFVLAAGVITYALGAAGLRPPARPAPGGDSAQAPAKPSMALVLRDRPYVALCAGQVLFALCASSLVVILPLSSVDPLRGPLWLPGASIVVGNVVLALAQKPAVRVANRFSRLAALRVGALVYVGTFFLLILADGQPEAVVLVVVLIGSMTGVIGEVLSMPLMTAAAQSSAAEGLEGRYSALFQTSWGLATVSAPALFTSLLTIGYPVLWLTMAGVAALTVPVLRAVAPRLPAGTLTQEAA